jgi:hypothetical protein
MRSIVRLLPVILASTLAATTPAQAVPAGLAGTDGAIGTFAGAQLRLSLGGATAPGDPRWRAGLTLAPRWEEQTDRGSRTMYGDGVLLGFDRSRSFGVSVGGARLNESSMRPPAGGLALSQGKWTLIAIGTVAVIGGLAIAYFSQDCERIFHDGQCNGD